jgi:hypothetical protein
LTLNRLAASSQWSPAGPSGTFRIDRTFEGGA